LLTFSFVPRDLQIISHTRTWAVNIDNIRVSMLQLGNSMKENGWVEAWLMNAFCRKLFRDNHPRKTNKHFFFNTTSVRFKCFAVSSTLPIINS
jgi:hypothetical protein